ncbi:hypothetical protein A2853_00855 [Candidatus Kaiserbacteria bacterium RIFCSPHIGHO2_01_FULL_55_17]|uniref:Uncharacterized protein n=1 Tax=Candidatus Kaiserbacteria bacterium RIFCSPHIGHO2_01_FULL_55_17 TaxID=1798484 RepID=A0A1F6D9A6_9BACT|nr:MAG: hypothetical protein A2853_00855 [Candidatus Kaiserbacteria bacterium RIFCSPHIGHO2_01_FULL_55_17]
MSRSSNTSIDSQSPTETRKALNFGFQVATIGAALMTGLAITSPDKLGAALAAFVAVHSGLTAILFAFKVALKEAT